MQARKEADMNTALHFSTGKDDWRTPDSVFEPLNREFGFELDLAADIHNRKVPCWMGPGSTAPDALTVPWRDYGTRGWCNPPYSRKLQPKFVAKAAAERLKGFTTVMLLPARTDTRIWHAHIWDADKHAFREGVEGRFVKGRIKFVGAPASAPFPSAIVIFRG